MVYGLFPKVLYVCDIVIEVPTNIFFSLDWDFFMNVFLLFISVNFLYLSFVDKIRNNKFNFFELVNLQSLLDILINNLKLKNEEKIVCLSDIDRIFQALSCVSSRFISHRDITSSPSLNETVNNILLVILNTLFLWKNFNPIFKGNTYLKFPWQVFNLNLIKCKLSQPWQAQIKPQRENNLTLKN